MPQVLSVVVFGRSSVCVTFKKNSPVGSDFICIYQEDCCQLCMIM